MTSTSTSHVSKPADMKQALLGCQTLEEAYKLACQCHMCPLSKTRTNVVFSRGNPKAKLMIIGEGPGRNEDEQGLPFVGRAGQLLDKILESVDICRENDVYICNIVKCRPPENRVPERAEMDACRGFLDRQIDLIKPKLILLAGATAVSQMLETKSPISKIRGQWFDGRHGAKVMPIFHPSYLLRNDTKKVGSPKWLMWQDIKEVKKELDRLA